MPRGAPGIPTTFESGMNDHAARQAVKNWFGANGLSVSDWAAQRGYKRDQVYAVLNGRTTGRRGTAHAIAVDLGLKAESKLTLQQALEAVAGEQRAPDPASRAAGE